MLATPVDFSAHGHSSGRFSPRFFRVAAFAALLFAPGASAWAANIGLDLASGPVDINTATHTYTGNGAAGHIFTMADTFTITGRSTSNAVKVSGPNAVGITLDGAHVNLSAHGDGNDAPDFCAFDMTGAKVNLTLANASTLSGEW